MADDITIDIAKFFAEDPRRITGLVGGVSLFLGFMLMYYQSRAKSTLNEMWGVKTCKASELRRLCSGGFKATVEVEGTVSCEAPLTALASQMPCCWFRTRVERLTGSRGSKGETREWDTVFDETFHTIFKVTDDTGYVLINPLKSDIEADRVCAGSRSARQAWFDEMGIPLSNLGQYRITEDVFPARGYAYVLGQASCCAEGTSPDAIIQYPDQGYADAGKKFFIISRKSEKELTTEHNISVTVCFWLSILAFGLASYCALSLLHVLP